MSDFAIGIITIFALALTFAVILNVAIRSLLWTSLIVAFITTLVAGVVAVLPNAPPITTILWGLLSVIAVSTTLNLAVGGVFHLAMRRGDHPPDDPAPQPSPATQPAAQPIPQMHPATPFDNVPSAAPHTEPTAQN